MFPWLFDLLMLFGHPFLNFMWLIIDEIVLICTLNNFSPASVSKDNLVSWRKEKNLKKFLLCFDSVALDRNVQTLQQVTQEYIDESNTLYISWSDTTYDNMSRFEFLKLWSWRLATECHKNSKQWKYSKGEKKIECLFKCKEWRQRCMINIYGHNKCLGNAWGILGMEMQMMLWCWLTTQMVFN